MNTKSSARWGRRGEEIGTGRHGLVDSGDEIIEWVRYRRIVVNLYLFSAALYVTERHQIKPVYKRAGAQTELTPDACKRGVYPDIEEYRKSRESVSTKAFTTLVNLKTMRKYLIVIFGYVRVYFLCVITQIQLQVRLIVRVGRLHLMEDFVSDHYRACIQVRDLRERMEVRFE